MARDYDALLLDLDGTLLTSDERVHPESARALAEAREAGVRVMVVTGRSTVATLPVLAELDLDSRSVIFNGAAVWCPQESRLVEERTLSNRTVARLLAWGRETGDLTIVMTADRKLAADPRDPAEERALDGLTGVEIVGRDELVSEYVIRTTFLTSRATDSAAYADEIERHVAHPVYSTHFPLSVLPRHRASPMVAVDVHPPCAGKAEALRVLEETYGIPPGRVVAVGDATNDGPMISRAGLGVAMGNAMEELKRIADRVIGHHDDGAIAGLIRELFT